MQHDSRYKDVIRELERLSDPAAVLGMARYGISSQNTLGISMPTLRRLAKDVGKDSCLARELWDSGIHEARILAALICRPRDVTIEQMEAWGRDFDSWDVCDQVCGNLFDKTPFAYEKALEWSARDEIFVKRAGFALMAWTAVHDRRLGDEYFLSYLAVIVRESDDDRNFVKKAVNWALRQIGKRNRFLNGEAVAARGRSRRRRRRAANGSRPMLCVSWRATRYSEDYGGSSWREFM